MVELVTVSPKAVADLSPEVVDDLSPEVLAVLSPEVLAALSAEVLAALSAEELAVLSFEEAVLSLEDEAGAEIAGGVVLAEVSSTGSTLILTIGCDPGGSCFTVTGSCGSSLMRMPFCDKRKTKLFQPRGFYCISYHKSIFRDRPGNFVDLHHIEDAQATSWYRISHCAGVYTGQTEIIGRISQYKQNGRGNGGEVVRTSS